MNELLIVLMKASLEKMSKGEFDKKLVKLNAQIRQVTLDVEKSIKSAE